MKSKKADITLNTFVGIIVAVLCLIALIYLAVSLYGLFIKKSERVQAEETLNQIVAKIKSLEDGEKDDYLIIAPEDWVLMARDKEFCICNWADIGSPYIDSSNRFVECLKEGICEKLDIELEISSLCYLTLNCFELKDVPVNLFFIKEEEVIKMKTKEDLVSEIFLKEIFDYKKEGDIKTLEEFLLEYLEKTTNERMELRVQIEGNLKDYFDKKIDSEKLFNVKKENFGWTFKIVEISNGIIHLDLNDFNLKETEFISVYKTKFGDNDEYLITLSLFRGEEEALPGYNPILDGP